MKLIKKLLEPSPFIVLPTMLLETIKVKLVRDVNDKIIPSYNVRRVFIRVRAEKVRGRQ